MIKRDREKLNLVSSFSEHFQPLAYSYGFFFIHLLSFYSLTCPIISHLISFFLF